MVLRHLPNAVTFLRIAAVPVIGWLIVDGNIAAAFWLVVAAGLTDLLDGFLAKQLDAVTPLGVYLDPIADKCLLIGVYLAAGHAGLLPAWLVFLAIVRDLLIVGGVLLSRLVDLEVKIVPLFVSKLNTVLQILLVSLVLAHAGIGLNTLALAAILIYVVALTTMISGALYMARWMSPDGGREISAMIEEPGE